MFQDNKKWLYLIILSLIWGSSFILMKRGLLAFTSDQVAGLRIFFSFIIFIPIIRTHIKHLKRKHLKSLLLVGFIGNAIPAYLFTTAQVHISSSLAGMLNSLTPFFALIIGLVFYRTSSNWLNVLGVFIGLFGALGLVVKDFSDIYSGFDKYALLVALATLMYGTSINEIKTNLSELSGVTIASLVFLFIGPISGILLIFSDLQATYENPLFWSSLFYVFLLALFSSVIAVVMFNTLIKYTTALFGASVTYIIPIFAIIWGLLDGETITMMQFLWISVIMLGVYLVNKK